MIMVSLRSLEKYLRIHVGRIGNPCGKIILIPFSGFAQTLSPGESLKGWPCVSLCSDQSQFIPAILGQLLSTP